MVTDMRRTMPPIVWMNFSFKRRSMVTILDMASQNDCAKKRKAPTNDNEYCDESIMSLQHNESKVFS